MMFDTLGYPPDHPDAAIAWRAVRKLLVVEPDRAYCQPCLSPVWDTGARRSRDGGGRRGHAMPRAPGCASGRSSTWSATGRCGGPGLRPGGWAFQYANPHYPGCRRHRGRRHAAASQRRSGVRRGDRAGARMDHRHAVLRRRLGRVRAGEHASLSEQHPVRRSWRAARSADRRCHRALRVVSGADRHAGGRSGDGARARRSCGASRRRRAAGSAAGAPTTSTARGRCCARSTPPASVRTIRRCGARVAWLLSVQRDDGGWGEDEETYRDAPHGRYKESTPSQTAWALLGSDGGGRGGQPGGGARHRVSDGDPGRGRRVGANCRTMRSVSRACSICAITAIAGISRCWHWHATAICAAATRAAWRLGSDNAAPRPLARGARVRDTGPLPPAPFRKGRGSKRSIGVVVGMAAEARIVRRLEWRVAIGGGSAAGAHEAARRLIEDGCDALVSFGLAAGLDPALRPGALIVPSLVVVSGDGRARPSHDGEITDPEISRMLGGATAHTLLGLDAVVATSPGSVACTKPHSPPQPTWRAARSRASPRSKACRSLSCARSATRRSVRCHRRRWSRSMRMARLALVAWFARSWRDLRNCPACSRWPRTPLPRGVPSLRGSGRYGGPRLPSECTHSQAGRSPVVVVRGAMRTR